MTTIVCQNLVSDFDFQLTTTTTTTLKLRVAEDNNDQYKSSSSISSMSAESLELCTENLGSESGSDVTSGDVNIFSSSSNPRRRKSTQDSVFNQKTKNLYPPPLTTIKNLQMRRHREGGRLIIEAVERNSYLQAERSDGRLRLCFIHDDEQQQQQHDGEDDDVDDLEKEQLEGEKNTMEMEKYQSWLSRCHNTRRINEGLCSINSNWNPALWVASSYIQNFSNSFVFSEF